MAQLLLPLAGLADDDDAVEKYRHVDPNDETAMRAVIRNLIVPRIRLLTDDSVGKLRQTFSFYLSSPEYRWADLFYSMMPPFDAPNDAK